MDSVIEAISINDYSNVPRIGFDTTPPVTRIVAFDSAYNMSENDYCELFDKTGASYMYVLGMYPDELVFPELPENNLYKFRIYKVGAKYFDLSDYNKLTEIEKREPKSLDEFV